MGLKGFGGSVCVSWGLGVGVSGAFVAFLYAGKGVVWLRTGDGEDFGGWDEVV